MKTFQKNLFKYLMLSAGFLFLLSGCKVFSLYPLYKTENLLFDASLLGTWQDPTDEEGWFVFSQLEDKTYKMEWFIVGENDAQKTDTASIVYKAKLLELGGKRYLDLFPMENTAQDFHISNLLPVHSFMSVNMQNNGQLVLREINSGRLKTLFEQNRVRLKHELVRENGLEPGEDQTGSELYVVITASTDDLQKFMLKYANDPKAFEEELVLSKLP